MIFTQTTAMELNPFKYDSLRIDFMVQYGSIDLVRWLKRKFPEVEFSMVVGEDAFIDITNDKWREVEARYGVFDFSRVLP